MTIPRTESSSGVNSNNERLAAPFAVGLLAGVLPRQSEAFSGAKGFVLNQLSALGAWLWFDGFNSKPFPHTLNRAVNSRILSFLKKVFSTLPAYSSAPLPSISARESVRKLVLPLKDAQGALVGVHDLRDLFHFKTLGQQSLKLFTINFEVMPEMLRCFHHFKIFKPVILLVSIYMMNVLPSVEFSTDRLFDDKPMFVKMSSAYADSQIAVAGDI
jgi:hypothetical protein